MSAVPTSEPVLATAESYVQENFQHLEEGARQLLIDILTIKADVSTRIAATQQMIDSVGIHPSGLDFAQTAEHLSRFRHGTREQYVAQLTDGLELITREKSSKQDTYEEKIQIRQNGFSIRRDHINTALLGRDARLTARAERTYGFDKLATGAQIGQTPLEILELNDPKLVVAPYKRRLRDKTALKVSPPNPEQLTDILRLFRARLTEALATIETLAMETPESVRDHTDQTTKA